MKRMSTSAWLFWKENFPDIHAELIKIEIHVMPTSMFTKVAKLQAKYDKVSDKNAKFGSQIGQLLDWLDNNSNQPYYAEYANDAQRPSRFGYSSGDKLGLIFYFFDLGDAIQFKLMFFDGSDN